MTPAEIEGAFLDADRRKLDLQRMAETTGVEAGRAGIKPAACPYAIAELKKAWKWGHQQGAAERLASKNAKV